MTFEYITDLKLWIAVMQKLFIHFIFSPDKSHDLDGQFMSLLLEINRLGNIKFNVLTYCVIDSSILLKIEIVFVYFFSWGHKKSIIVCLWHSLLTVFHLHLQTKMKQNFNYIFLFNDNIVVHQYIRLPLMYFLQLFFVSN